MGKSNVKKTWIIRMWLTLNTLKIATEFGWCTLLKVGRSMEANLSQTRLKFKRRQISATDFFCIEIMYQNFFASELHHSERLDVGSGSQKRSQFCFTLNFFRLNIPLLWFFFKTLKNTGENQLLKFLRQIRFHTGECFTYYKLSII